METCRVTPSNNIIDYVCGLPSRGGKLREPDNLPPPPPIDDTSFSFIDVEPLPLPPPETSDVTTSEFMSSDIPENPPKTDFAQPVVLDGVEIHHYSHPQPLIVPGTHAHGYLQPVPSFEKIVTTLPPLVPLIRSYQGKALEDFERLIRQMEHENMQMATEN